MSNIAPRITYPSYKRPDPLKEAARREELGPPETVGLFRLFLNCPITRRKTYHIIENPEGEVVFSERSASAAFEWLEAEGQHRLLMCTQTDEFLVRFERLPKSERT